MTVVLESGQASGVIEIVAASTLRWPSFTAGFLHPS